MEHLWINFHLQRIKKRPKIRTFLIMKLRNTPLDSADQLQHDRARITRSSCCTVEGERGYGKWFEVPSQDTRSRIYVVLGWQNERRILEHAALADQRGFDCLQVPAGGFVFEDSTGFYVYGSSGAYGSGNTDAAGIIENHFREIGEHKRIIRGKP